MNSVQFGHKFSEKPARDMTGKTVIFVSQYDPRKVANWSGTIYSLYQALNHDTRGARVRYIGGAFRGALDLGARVLNKIVQKFGVSFDCRFSTTYAVIAGIYLTIRLSLTKGETVVAVAASNYFAYVRTTKRIIYISDGTFRVVSDLYPAFKAFPKWLSVQGDHNE